MTEQLFYKCILCYRSTKIDKNIKTMEIDSIRMFVCGYCGNGLN
jgi:hypothetical protein